MNGTWLPLAQCQKELYARVRNDPLLSKYPVFTISESGAEQDNVGLQFITIPGGAGTSMPDGTQFANYANCHNYVVGHDGYQDNQAWFAADYQQNSWPGDGLPGNFGKTWGKGYTGYSTDQLKTLPKVTTETGWSSSKNAQDEYNEGVVMTNTYLSQFKRGWRYTFIYEMIDAEGSLGNQGIYHADNTPKPLAHFIHNLTKILADSKDNPNIGQLNYSIDNQPETVHDLLLQKSDGTFELVVWDERNSPNKTDNITVNLGGTHTIVNVYDITKGTSPTQVLNNAGSVPLTLSDHAMIINLK
jgi:hypothetical protein